MDGQRNPTRYSSTPEFAAGSDPVTCRYRSAYEPEDGDVPRLNFPAVAPARPYIVRIEALSHNIGDREFTSCALPETPASGPISSGITPSTSSGPMTRPAPMFYEWAEPGTGKSNFACLLGQLWKEQQPSDALVASNIRTLEETDEWTDSDGDRRDGWLANYGERTGGDTGR